MTILVAVQILAIKLLVNWLRGQTPTAAGLDRNCKAVMNLLETTLTHDGDLQAADNIA